MVQFAPCLLILSLLLLPIHANPIQLDEGPFGAFWNNKAHFQFITATNFSGDGEAVNTMWMLGNSGTHFVVHNKVWYLFSREWYVPSVIPAACNGGLFRIVLRNSSDEGRTWSKPFTVANPPDAPWGECTLMDGCGYFDTQTITWHYLSQCVGSGRWNLCHYYRQSDSPTGPWIPNSNNPVVKGGELWSRICNGSSKHCSPGTIDEGTPEIVMKKDGWFFVTFHGYDYDAKRSARGVAKTQDFVSWTIKDSDLPGDTIFSSLDCNKWQTTWAPGGCVGGGEGTILKSGDYYYQLIEATETNLWCQDDQWWLLGLVRSTSLTSISGEWEQFKVDPTVIPQNKNGCSEQYHRLFVDNDTIYLSYWVLDYSLVDKTIKTQMQIFKLVPGAGKLPMIASIPANND